MNEKDVEFIKMLSISDVVTLQAEMNDSMRLKLDEIGVILLAYHHENTRNTGTRWINEFLNAGISKDDGKAAIACIRRLGIEIA